MIIRTFAISLNWNCSPNNDTQRDVPPTPLPIARVSASSASWMKYSGQAKVLSQW